MSVANDIITLSYKAERAASRKLARSAQLDPEQALRTVLEQVAGARGIDALLAERRAQLLADQDRLAARDERRALARAGRLARHDGPAAPWRAWFDGSAHPNPGHCGIGALLLGPAGERIEIARAIGYGNSSEAEYQALIAVLEAARDAGARGLTVCGDSRVVLDDVLAPEQHAAPSLRPYRANALALLAALGNVALHWIPRRRNLAADALSQRGVAGPP